jgi:Rieske Fe-S protein
VLAGGAAGASACSAAPSTSPAYLGDVAAGNASALTVPSLNVVQSMPVCIGRDSGGIYAMTLTCTHAGCDIGKGTVGPSGLACPCHASQFDANGKVTHNPATIPLEHFAVSFDSAGNITIHTGQTVSPDTRYTPP